MKKKIEVGLTGGIGAGKSHVASIFSKWVPTYPADTRAKWLMQHHPSLKEKIIAMLGEQVYAQDGSLQKEQIGAIVFGNSPKSTAFLSMVFEAVYADYNHWVAPQRAPYVLHESALLFTHGLHKHFHQIILVTAPERLRMQRVLQRDPARKEEEVMQIMAKQPPMEGAITADFFIVNDDKEPLHPQVVRVHEALVKRVADRD